MDKENVKSWLLAMCRSSLFVGIENRWTFTDSQKDLIYELIEAIYY